MSRIDAFLRYLATWPAGRLSLTMYQDRGRVVMMAVNIDGKCVLGPAEELTVDECVVTLMQAALTRLAEASWKSGEP